MRRIPRWSWGLGLLILGVGTPIAEAAEVKGFFVPVPRAVPFRLPSPLRASLPPQTLGQGWMVSLGSPVEGDWLVLPLDDPQGQQWFQMAQQQGSPLTLGPQLTAYFYSQTENKSIFWQQDGWLYGIRSDRADRQQLLYWALQTSHSSPRDFLPSSPVAGREAAAAPPLVPQEVTVQSITLVGSSLYKNTDFAEAIAALVGQPLNNDKLTDLANQITQRYLGGGYITSRAEVDAASLVSGKVIIRAIEGSLEAIEVKGNGRLNANYIRDRLDPANRTPLNSGELEKYLRLLQLDPLFSNVEASLKAGQGLGKSILTVNITPADPFSGNVAIDNYSTPSVGSERASLNLLHRNVTGLGDLLNLGLSSSTAGGVSSADLSYVFPLNGYNGTLQLRGSWSRNAILPWILPFSIRGESALYDVTWRQPIFRDLRSEFALSLGMTYQSGLTFVGDQLVGFSVGTDNGISRSTVFKFAQEFTHRDGAGVWALRSQLNFGSDLFGATVNIHPIPDSRFFSWLGQVQRVQALNPSNLLIIQGDLQLSGDSLLPSQQFVIGGGQSLRGYRQNLRAGDSGFRLSLENRITIEKDESGKVVWQVAPFLDLGSIWNRPNNPNQPLRHTTLAGTGIGLLWNPFTNLNIRMDYGMPLVPLAPREAGNNAQDRGFYFNVNYNF